MPDAVTFTKLSEQTRITRIYKLDGADPATLPFSRTAIRPTRLTVVITDGTVNGISLWGPRLKKDGTDGQVTSAGDYYSRRDWPAWIVTFLEGMGL